jgi:alkaline phosphatase
MYITDSAAAGTAISSGKKTNNGVIGKSPGGENYKSILELAEEKKLATGLVATSVITHATPASFIAHDDSRGNYETIALNFLETDIDVFIGGGFDHFGKRSDGLNLIDSLKNKGYQVETSLEGILNAKSDKLAGFTAPGDNPYRLEGRGNMLPASSKKAIEILSKNPDGFFLMIEGSQIDWAAHDNNQKLMIDETLDFDEAIGVALDFAAKDGHTLVVVTADHETGGVTVLDGNLTKKIVKLGFSSKGHTGIMVPVFSYGPCSAAFSGIYDNTDFFNKFLGCYGF